MSSIPFFARRRLCSTFNAQEVGQLRAALQEIGRASCRERVFRAV